MFPQSFFRFVLAVAISAGGFLLVDTLQRALLAPVDLGVDNPYLPAGIRLLAVLVFGFAGACGLTLATLLTAPGLFPGADPAVLVVAAQLNGLVPLASLAVVRRLFGISEELLDLSFRAVLTVAALQSLLSPLAYQLLFRLTGIAPASTYNLLAMIAGDMIGSMLVLLLVALVWGLARRI